MRQTPGAAEKLFVDFAGAAAGMDRRAHIFVAVLGATNQETMVRRDPPFQSVPQLLARTFKPRSAQSR
jgi:hypothetical protein